MKTIKVAMIGTGDISGIYLKNITETFTALQRFAARGADSRFPEVARFAGDVVQSLIGAGR